MKKSKKKLIAFIAFIMFLFTNFIGIFGNNNVFASTLPLNVTIKTEETEIPTGRFVEFNLKYEVTNYNALKEGDQITIEIPNELINVSPIYSKQHFKSVVKEDNRIILTFGPRASTALAGYIGLGAIANNEGTKPKDAVVNVIYGDKKVSKKITILPMSTGGPGEETRTLVKFTERYGINASGEYTYVQQEADSGIMYPNCDKLEYHIEVNPKGGNLRNVVLEDSLPFETELIDDSIEFMTFIGDHYEKIPMDTFPIIKDKNNLIINFGNLRSDQQYRIKYKVKVLNNQVKFSNTAKVEYIENGQRKVEMQDFYAKPYNYAGAVNGYKIVDKSIISNSKEDQSVVYTIKFENDNVFGKNEINLVDKLDRRIKFIDAIASEEFAVNYDADRHAVYISNKNGAIPANTRREIKIITDFTNVKPGETVKNTVGGNTTVTKKKYMYKFKKVDSITGEPLNGAVFKVVDKNGFKVLDNIVTDSNGIGRIELIDEGEYKLIETKAPKGYNILENEQEIVVSGNQKVIKKTIYNKRITGNITVKKVDSKDNTKVLKGAKFEIIDLSGNKVAELETGADGIATYENLPYGEYKLVEVQPPVGYKILNPEKSFNINEQGQIVNLQFENQLIVGQVVIEKVDSENENIKLADAKFQIKDVKGNIVESIVTDEKGIGSVNLVPGDYTLTEIKAPNGYQLLASPIEIKINVDGTAIVDGKNVEVDKDSNNIQLHIGNSKFLEMPITGGEGNGKYIFGGLALMISAVAIFIISKNKL
ncbi:collagen binding domain-containing protein [Clostridium cadaveris]|uniref:MSCRAMM family protein n=1 Tax=Clostridium cadaveris TaxID=1529 RepID=UPI0015B40832|nr:SpaA isopeptide-forming pilin-related protein [Clostridium cadaveris]NWK12055.1 hypothetical protein [Clostridium cadaveris]